MKPALVSYHTINDINNKIKNNKILKDRYRMSLIINVFLFIVMLIGLYILYRRYKNKDNSVKNDSIKTFYTDVNKLYNEQNRNKTPIRQQNNIPQKPQNPHAFMNTRATPINSGNSYSQLLPPPANTFNGDNFTNNISFSQNNDTHRNINTVGNISHNNTNNNIHSRHNIVEERGNILNNGNNHVNYDKYTQPPNMNTYNPDISLYNSKAQHQNPHQNQQYQQNLNNNHAGGSGMNTNNSDLTEMGKLLNINDLNSTGMSAYNEIGGYQSFI